MDVFLITLTLKVKHRFIFLSLCGYAHIVVDFSYCVLKHLALNVFGLQ